MAELLYILNINEANWFVCHPQFQCFTSFLLFTVRVRQKSEDQTCLLECGTYTCCCIGQVSLCFVVRRSWKCLKYFEKKRFILCRIALLVARSSHLSSLLLAFEEMMATCEWCFVILWIEWRFRGGDTMRWYGHSNPTICKRICLNFLHSQVAGT